MKKILSIIVIGLSLILITLMPSVISEQEINDVRAKLYAFGFIRIDSHKYEINGFVLTGNNAGKVLLFEQINIKYDGSPILVCNPLPFIFNIKYNPAEQISDILGANI